MRGPISGFLVFLAFCATTFSQTVNITGKVTSSSGQAIEGAVIQIFNTALACTSNTDGTYQLTDQTKISNLKQPQLSVNRITFHNHSFSFQVAKAAHVNAKLFDMRGRLVTTIFDGRMQPGITRLPVTLKSTGYAMLLLRVNIDNNKTTYRVNPAMMEKGFTLNQLSQRLEPLPRTAAVDWLQASKSGFSSHVQSIDNYVGVINITLNNLAAPNFGNNVKIFDPSMQMSTIQSTIDGLRNASEMSTQRIAYLFKPGNYNVTVRVQYYIHAMGLGMSPDDVNINGEVRSEGQLTAFWRCAENMCVTPSSGTNQWAVSQAAPFRRMHVKGKVVLATGGGSGGWFSDCKIDDQINPGWQQQFYFRNCQLNGWQNSSMWNMLFHGVINPPPSRWPDGPESSIDTVPFVREKPFLVIDDDGKYGVFVPAIRKNTKGTTWYNATPAGTTIPIDQFYIAQAGTDNVTTINAALAQGKNLLLTPGIYNVTAPIQILRPNTVVLGIGLPSIVSQDGTIGMKVADVDGITIAGIMFDASGSTEVPVQLQVGDTKTSVDHSANPTFLFDIFSRIGGYVAGKVAASVIINSNNVVFDHCWIWRADHGTGVGWTNNVSKNGMIVNGDDVICYGQFMEHHEQYQTVWNGNRGRNYFYQNEMPYDVPDQASFNHDGKNGWASYRVGDAVTIHECWAAGAYAFFNRAPILIDHGFETPNLPGIKFHKLFTFSLGGNLGTITHVINDTGPASNNSNTFVKLTEYVGGQ